MSRRRRVIHKTEKLDARYGSPIVERRIASVMQDGKKSLAERIVYTAIEETRTGTDAVDPPATICEIAVSSSAWLPVKV